MILAVYLLIGLFATIVPIALAPVFKRRWPSSYWVLLVGAVTFAASQVVHIPALYGLSLLNGPLAELPAPVAHVLSAIILGLAAGLCEEWARYIAFQWALKKYRSFSDSLMHGLGHGGIEAVFLLGLMAIASALTMWAMTRAGADALSSTPEDRELIATTIHDFWATSPWQVLWGLIERAIVLPFHIALSVLVAYAVRRSKVGFVWLAVLMHTVLDFIAAYSPHVENAPGWAIEAALAAVTVLSIAIVARLPNLRDPEPREAPT